MRSDSMLESMYECVVSVPEAVVSAADRSESRAGILGVSSSCELAEEVRWVAVRVVLAGALRVRWRG